tara:strand:+ start:3110 stop:3238 length:129 start_codon:yes stop_codon:yes gene_type:complete
MINPPKKTKTTTKSAGQIKKLNRSLFSEKLHPIIRKIFGKKR